MKDPIVAEIRMFRDEHSKKFNYDLSKICRDFREKQEKHKNRLISLKRKNYADNKLLHAG